MSIQTAHYPAELDGQAVTAESLLPLAFAGFAHFTAMQVRGRRVKGLDLHVKRLREASMAFFGRALADDEVLARIRSVIAAGEADMSLTVTVFPSSGEFTADSMAGGLSVLVRSGAPARGPAGPLRLSTVEHQRPHARIKHVGESGKTYFLHQAVREGFDDAAFVDAAGRLTEATIWNLVFWDGEAVVWPQGELLIGTMMGSVQRQLARQGVPQRYEDITLERLRELAGAAVMNSWTPGIAVTAIGSVEMPPASRLIELLHGARAAEPDERI
jgi:branched-subunit amino acid aminotransferase/4-amino-4-deoxychorismate lyase